MLRRPSLLTAPSAPWPWAVAGAVLGLVSALILFAPARWVASRVGSATAGQVLLHDARGTVWNGSAQLVLTGGAGSTDTAALPTRLNWRLRPGAAGLNAQLNSACCTTEPLTVRLRPGWGRMQARVGDGQSRWPAALLQGLGTPWNTLQLDGDLVLDTKSLELDWAAGRLAVAGRAELTAQRVSSRLTTLKPMGSYRLTLAGGAVPGLQLTTLDGSLQLSGSGQWVGSRLRFNGEAAAAPDREAALSNLLNIIGRRNGARSIITIG
jgi:general secretion pathway protein N